MMHRHSKALRMARFLSTQSRPTIVSGRQETYEWNMPANQLHSITCHGNAPTSKKTSSTDKFDERKSRYDERKIFLSISDRSILTSTGSLYENQDQLSVKDPPRDLDHVPDRLLNRGLDPGRGRGRSPHDGCPTLQPQRLMDQQKLWIPWKKCPRKMANSQRAKNMAQQSQKIYPQRRRQHRRQLQPTSSMTRLILWKKETKMLLSTKRNWSRAFLHCIIQRYRRIMYL